jgi:CRISPR-associated protein (TIGR03984 family)
MTADTKTPLALSLCAALTESFKKQQAYGLLLSASACEWATWEGEALKVIGGERDLPFEAYEARFFNEEKQLLWRRSSPDGAGHVHLSKVSDAKRMSTENSYLLWGKFGKQSGQLEKLPRGTMHVPTSGQAGNALQLHTIELLDEDDCGNLHVKGEVWIRLEAQAEAAREKAHIVRKKKRNSPRNESPSVSLENANA